jgi:hypothetical protein
MSDLDFIFFGIKPNNQNLKKRICEALSDSVGVEFSPLNQRKEVLEIYRKRRSIGQKQELIENSMMTSEQLLVCYLFMWRVRMHTRIFFQCCGIKNTLDIALELRNQIEAIATTSKLYLVVLDIFQEFDTYSFQWEETRKHIKKQRNILSATKTRKRFIIEIEKRDGVGCKNCGLTENLHIDHIKPVSLGGFSVLENLQLLCAPCNYKKQRKSQLEFLRSKVMD